MDVDTLATVGVSSLSDATRCLPNDLQHYTYVCGRYAVCHCGARLAVFFFSTFLGPDIAIVEQTCIPQTRTSYWFAKIALVSTVGSVVLCGIFKIPMVKHIQF